MFTTTHTALILRVSFLIVVIPGIYGMTKIWKWWQKRQILLRKKARGHQNIDALIEEAEGEMD